MYPIDAKTEVFDEVEILGIYYSILGGGKNDD